MTAAARVCARPGCGRSLADMRVDAVWCSRACKMAFERAQQAEQRANGIASMTQTERVVRALRLAGERGITQIDFLLPNVIDGGKPITRVAARVKDAREQGEAILVDGERDSCVIYKTAAQAPAPQPPADDATGGALFDMPAPRHNPANALTEEAA
jgi:hypothetical protein